MSMSNNLIKHQLLASQQEYDYRHIHHHFHHHNSQKATDTSERAPAKDKPTSPKPEDQHPASANLAALANQTTSQNWWDLKRKGLGSAQRGVSTSAAAGSTVLHRQSSLGTTRQSGFQPRLLRSKTVKTTTLDHNLTSSPSISPLATDRPTITHNYTGETRPAAAGASINFLNQLTTGQVQSTLPNSHGFEVESSPATSGFISGGVAGHTNPARPLTQQSGSSYHQQRIFPHKMSAAAHVANGTEAIRQQTGLQPTAISYHNITLQNAQAANVSHPEKKSKRSLPALKKGLRLFNIIRNKNDRNSSSSRQASASFTESPRQPNPAPPNVTHQFEIFNRNQSIYHAHPDMNPLTYCHPAKSPTSLDPSLAHIAHHHQLALQAQLQAHRAQAAAAAQQQVTAAQHHLRHAQHASSAQLLPQLARGTSYQALLEAHKLQAASNGLDPPVLSAVKKPSALEELQAQHAQQQIAHQQLLTQMYNRYTIDNIGLPPVGGASPVAQVKKKTRTKTSCSANKGASGNRRKSHDPAAGQEVIDPETGVRPDPVARLCTNENLRGVQYQEDKDIYQRSVRKVQRWLMSIPDDVSDTTI